jgi:hypothetical protein
MLIHLRESAQKDVQLSSFSSKHRMGHPTALAELEWSARDETTTYPRVPTVLVSIKSESLVFS